MASSMDDAAEVLRAALIDEDVIEQAKRDAALLAAVFPPPTFDVYRVRVGSWWIRVPRWVYSLRWSSGSRDTAATVRGPRVSRDPFGGVTRG